MPLADIQFKPGFYRNGTPYGRKMRWEDGSLVRWHDGAWKPIGGWARRQNNLGVDIDTPISDPTQEAIRDIFAWRSNDQSQNIVFGSNLGAYHLGTAGTLTDITYAGYSATNTGKDADTDAGYGQNPYGLGSFGAANALTGQDPVPPNRWYFDNYGEVLIYGSRNNGGMYELDLNTLTGSLVTNAPTKVQDVCVTDQRQIMAIGGNGEPRRVQTSDSEDRTEWTPATDNQSIDRVLGGTGRLLRVVQLLKQELILGENDAHAARYVGPPYIYSIDPVGENCGPVAAEAVVVTDRFAVWWGRRNFWLYDGSVQVLECDVIDYLYDDIEEQQVSKISAFTISDYNEIWWLYQSTSSTTTEVDSYVVWDYAKNIWYTGRIDRTAGIDRGVVLDPIMVDHDGYIYNQELPNVFPLVGDCYVASGAIRLGKGEQNIAVRFIFPDTENTNDVTFTLTGRQFPNDTEYTYGPYAYSNPVPTSGAMGRSIKLRADFQQVNSKLGVPQFDVAPVGTGKR